MHKVCHILEILKSQDHFFLSQETTVSRETHEKLLILYQWHEKCRQYSSFAKYRDEEDFWVRHVGNCLRLTPFLKQEDVILDIGSGGGFPGLVLAAAGFKVILSDIDRKKRFFLKEALRLMALDGEVIEDSRAYQGSFSVVTARAVSSLKNLLSLIPNVSRETRCLFLKGKNIESELEQVRKKKNLICKVHSYNEGVIVEALWKMSL